MVDEAVPSASPAANSDGGIHDLGYRRIKARADRHPFKFWIIATTCMGLAWQSAWLKRIVTMSMLPMTYFAFIFLGYELMAVDPTGMGRTFVQSLAPVFHDMDLLSALQLPPEVGRSQVWRHLLYQFFRTPQTFGIVLVFGLVTPSLISRDLRTRAFLLYFSKPLTRFDYLLGKLMTPVTFGAIISTAVAIGLYVIAIAMSPTVSVVTTTWDVPLRVLAASVVLLIPTASVALALSALGTDTRYCTFAWYASWIVGFFAYSIHLDASAHAKGELPATDHWYLISPYHTLGLIQEWIFGVGASFSQARLPLILVTTITVFAWVFLFRRVSSPMRA